MTSEAQRTAEAVGGAAARAANFERLKQVLDELFMFDRADLDFGLYRIMNVRREEIRRFLDHDLMPLVGQALGRVQEADRASIAGELREAETAARTAGFDPEQSPRVQELRARYDAGANIEAAEAEVYDRLAGFFRRYYKEGDFISQRRYKEGVYAIPYEGEEVKLHWANADQYYVKTTEQFRDYSFVLPDGRRVHFKLVEADTERNNNRAQAGNDRRFILAATDAVEASDEELLLRFEYRPDAGGRRQDALNEDALERVLADPAASAWRTELQRSASGAPDAPSLLAKHLRTYAAKNTFDYFIHKDLGGFLRRELDFYVKNEVMHLDDIDTEEATPAGVSQYLAKLRAIRAVALPIIEFLAKLEEFQKRLWLKKKFVVATDWCVTLDRVPRDLYAEIAANEAQRAEWVKLFSIDEIAGDMVSLGYTEPMTEAFLAAHPYLPVDTAFFRDDPTFTQRILSTIDDLDASTDGLLIASENLQALNLLQDSHRSSVNCVYIDPPYNTGNGDFVYRDQYQHSTWLAMMDERLRAISQLLGAGVIFASVDDHEQRHLVSLMDEVFGKSNAVACVTVVSNPQGRSDKADIASAHEYLVIYAGSKGQLRGWSPEENVMRRYNKSDVDGRYREIDLRKTGDADRRADRPDMYYYFFHDPTSGELRVSRDHTLVDGFIRISPVRDDEKDPEGRWRWGFDTAQQRLHQLVPRQMQRRASWTVYEKDYLSDDERVKPTTVWSKSAFLTHFGSERYEDLGFTEPTALRPKPVGLLEHVIEAGLPQVGTILDCFAGSGTTGEAIINLNRNDSGQRRYILVEMGEYFDSALKPRVLKAAYSKDWRDGKPVGRDGVSHLVKVLRLESYEDTLNNLRVRRAERQASLLEQQPELRSEYMLRYWLDTETRGSASLLDLDAFRDPWAYQLEVGQGSAAETRPVTVDLVETFNYLLGLRVRKVDHIRGVTLVQGTLPPAPGRETGERALVIWRKVDDLDSAALDAFLWTQRINPRDMEFDVIYVNGDNHLENSRREDETWKVRLIEEEFQRLMFETAEAAAN